MSVSISPSTTRYIITCHLLL